MKTMAKPLLNIYGKREPFCDYPTVLRIAMDDGTVQKYILENRSEYQFNNVLKCINRMAVGYQYKEPVNKRKRRLKRWQL